MKWFFAIVLVGIAGAACSNSGDAPADIRGTWGFYFIDTTTVVDGVPSACGAVFGFVMSQNGSDVTGTQLIAHDFRGNLQNTAYLFCFALSNPSVRTTVIQTNTYLGPATMNGKNFEFQISTANAHATGSETVDSAGVRGFAGNAMLSFTSPGGVPIHLNAYWVAQEATGQ